MPRPKKGERTPGSGRKKGRPNRTTQAVKDMVLGALHAVGGQQYFEAQAAENPVAFMSLIGKILPSEIKQEITGKDGAPLIPDMSLDEKAAKLAGLLALADDAHDSVD